MAGLFGSKGGAESASPGYDGITAAGPDRRKLILAGVGGLVVVALLAFVVLPMLLGGGSDSSGGPVVAARRNAAAGAVTPTPSATPSDDFTLAPAAAYGDPFAPLPEEAAATEAAAPVAVPTIPSAGTAAPTATSSGSASGSGATTPSATGTTTADSKAATTDNAPAAGKPVQVMAIKGTSADIQIDSKAYTVKAGDAPVSGYSVTGVGGGKVTFTRNGTTHALAEGELQTF